MEKILAAKSFQGKTQNMANEKLNISHYLFLLFWIVKPLYIGPSGTMQVADFFFILSFGAWITHHRGRVLLEKNDLILFGFIFSTLVINGVYAVIRGDPRFLSGTAYYVFNLLIVVIMRDFIKNRLFLKALLWMSSFNLILQLLVLVLRQGRYYWGVRFMGTFNDPNQFSFSVFTSFLVIFILSSYFKDYEQNRRKLTVLLMFSLSLFFIFIGSSTGMLLGIASCAVLVAFSFINSERTPAFMLLRTLALLLLSAIVLYVLVFGVAPGNLDGSVNSSSFLIQRVVEKLGKVDSGGITAILKERGIDKLFHNPASLFFGAGEGGYGRFLSSPYEVHSTLPAILFYYGIIPFLLLCRWIWLNLKDASKLLIPAYLALLIESFTLANQRQPALWIIIVLGSLEYSNAHKSRKYHLMADL